MQSFGATIFIIFRQNYCSSYHCYWIQFLFLQLSSLFGFICLNVLKSATKGLLATHISALPHRSIFTYSRIFSYVIFFFFLFPLACSFTDFLTLPLPSLSLVSTIYSLNHIFLVASYVSLSIFLTTLSLSYTHFLTLSIII